MTIDFNKVPRYVRSELEKGSKPIKRGQKGVAVKRVQEWLRYHECRTNIDSDYGPATMACVRKFQRKAGAGSGEQRCCATANGKNESSHGTLNPASPNKERRS